MPTPKESFCQTASPQLKGVWLLNSMVSEDLLRVQGHGLALSESPCGSDNH